MWINLHDSFLYAKLLIFLFFTFDVAMTTRENSDSTVKNFANSDFLKFSVPGKKKLEWQHFWRIHNSAALFSFYFPLKFRISTHRRSALPFPRSSMTFTLEFPSQCRVDWQFYTGRCNKSLSGLVTSQRTYRQRYEDTRYDRADNDLRYLSYNLCAI